MMMLTQEVLLRSGALAGNSGRYKNKRVIGRWSPETSDFPYSGTDILDEIVCGLLGGFTDVFD